MAYEIEKEMRDAVRTGGRLHPEEEEVSVALRAYSDDPAKAEITDFVPTHILYSTYLAYAHSVHRYPGDPEILFPAKFGIALLEVFPSLREVRDGAPSHAHPRINGRQVWGYRGLVGPGSLTIRLTPGRPPRPASAARLNSVGSK